MAQPPESATAVSAPRKTLAENVRETLEGIVIAFILAFVFRAFIVEAFIIPTGSMAPTLYGEHLVSTCPTCGFQYAVGVPEQASRSAAPANDLRSQCPNCDAPADFKGVDVGSPHNGDRIVVHKWPFDLGGELLGPKRWDVVVFKDPRDGTTNFIKRLIGLPGEMLEIIDGDIYTVPVSKLKPELLQTIDQLRRDVYQYRLELPETREEQRKHRDEFVRRYAEINAQLLPQLKIERKLPGHQRAQESLWFIVYDQDALPHYHSTFPQDQRVRWEPVDAAAATAWKAQGREIEFNSQSSDPLELRFAGKPIADFYAYNVDRTFDWRDVQGQLVGDLRLRFMWFPESGTGGLSLSMNRDTDRFLAEIGMDGSVSVRGIRPDSNLPGHRQTIGEKKLPPLAPGRAVEVEFMLLDYRVALHINGQEVIASTDEQYRPDPAKLARFIHAAQRGQDGMIEPGEVKPSEVRIAAWNQSCRLRHVVLERDVYYRSQRQNLESWPDERGQMARNPYYLWPGWGTAGLPIMLRPPRTENGKHFGGEYFMLGDNSPASKDSRLWWEIGPHLRPLGADYQVATVPQDQLIGKAFFVYWPAGYRTSWLPGFGIIPNVGKMRWIR